MASAPAALPRAAVPRTLVRATGEPWLFRMSLAAAVCTYLLVVAGATVRVTGSGLGCPDWPTCHGRLIPPLDTAALIEYTHRLLGALATPLILAVPVGAWLARRSRPVLAPALALPLLLVLQIALGAAVVRLELAPLAVLVHLGFALLILAGLVWVTAFEAPPGYSPAAGGRSYARPLGLLAALTFAVVLTGAYTRASGASVACAGFPGCDAPLQALSALGGPPPAALVTIHMGHRTLAYVVAAAGLAGAAVVWRRRRGAARVAAAALALALVVQVVVGAAAVSSGLPAALRGGHVAGAAAVWAATVLLLALEVRAAPGGGAAGPPT